MLDNFREILDFDLFTIQDVVVTVEDVMWVVVLFAIIQMVIIALRITLSRLAKRREQLDKGKRFTIVQLARYFLYLVFFYAALELMGFDPKGLLFASGAFVVALGLGLQKLFLDFVSGIIILMEGSMQVGDIIEVGGMICKVQRVDIRTTKVITRDGNYITIPNGQITEGQVTNWSQEDEESRFNISVGVAYGSNVDLVRDLLIAAAKGHPHVLNNREVMVFFNEFGDNALEFKLYFWAHQSWTMPKTMSEIRFAVEKTFRDNGVEIPFPQRDVWMRNADENLPKKR